MLALIVGAVALAALSLAYGAYAELVAKPNAPLAKVNGIIITRRDYEKYRKYELMRQIQFLAGLGSSGSNYADQLLQEMRSVPNSPPDSSTLRAMVNSLLVRQKSSSLGVELNDEQLQAEIREQFAERVSPTPVPQKSSTSTPSPAATESHTPFATTPTPTLSAAELANAEANWRAELRNVEQATGMTESEYLDWVLVPGILRAKIQQKLEAQLPSSADQVRARHILFDSKDAADMAYYMLTEQNYAFDRLAKERSSDSYTKDTGGDLGWFPRGLMGDAFDQVVFSLKPGEISKPFETKHGWEIVQVLEVAQNRPIDGAVLEQMKGQVFDRWLEQVRKSSDIQFFVPVEQPSVLPFIPPASAPTPEPSPTPTATPTGTNEVPTVAPTSTP